MGWRERWGGGSGGGGGSGSGSIISNAIKRSWHTPQQFLCDSERSGGFWQFDLVSRPVRGRAPPLPSSQPARGPCQTHRGSAGARLDRPAFPHEFRSKMGRRWNDTSLSPLEPAPGGFMNPRTASSASIDPVLVTCMGRRYAHSRSLTHRRYARGFFSFDSRMALTLMEYLTSGAAAPSTA